MENETNWHDYNDFCRWWKIEGHKTNLRVGQAFVNRYYKYPDPELFYETNKTTAWDLIVTRCF